MANIVDVAIIGSGPYGLSLAAHLRKTKTSFRIFGKPMGTWRNHMPAGMSLKSEGFASDLYDPEGLLPLKAYCAKAGIPYADIGTPVELSTFYSYGVAFQQQFVPNLEESFVTDLSRRDGIFEITLENGDMALAYQVVLAAGIGHYPFVPTELSDMPPELVTHSSKYHSFESFAGRDVAVIGAGSSAVDVAVALKEAGARPQLVTRRARVPFHGKAPDTRPLLTRIKAPWSGLGPSWRSRLCCDMPTLFHFMPLAFRTKVVKKHLGPAPGWSTEKKVVGKIPMHVGMCLEGAEVEQGKLRLKLRSADGMPDQLLVDHVIAGTGYKVDLTRLRFMREELRREIVTENQSPRLSRYFESSVEGLYFVGTPAALSFGPLLRFAFGARFASTRLKGRLASQARQLRKKASTAKQQTSQPFFPEASQPEL